MSLLALGQPGLNAPRLISRVHDAIIDASTTAQWVAATAVISPRQ
jgi:hypothetical protein